MRKDDMGIIRIKNESKDRFRRMDGKNDNRRMEILLENFDWMDINSKIVSIQIDIKKIKEDIDNIDDKIRPHY